MISLLLYTTSGCHLCEEAQALLDWAGQQVPLQVSAVEISGDAALVERYGIRIPVVQRAVDGAELGWPFDGPDLLAFLNPA